MKGTAVLLGAVALAFGAAAVGGETSPPSNEPPAILIVDPPVPDLLNRGVVWITWRVENVRIGPVTGKDALQASPRVGHLHVSVDDLPWLWAHMSTNPIDVALLPPGPHTIRIELVNAVHQGIPEQSKTVTFTIPEGASPSP